MSPRLSALRLSLAYLAIAIAWAFLSDHLLQNQVQDHDQLVFWMTAKRLFFFAATGLLLYLYLVRQFRRKAQAYDELHGSEQRLNRALEAVRDGLWDWDLVTDRMFVSPGYAALIGLAPEELGDPIETWKKRLHPEEYATVLEAHRNHLQGLTDNLDHIYRLRHKDATTAGSTRAAGSSATPWASRCTTPAWPATSPCSGSRKTTCARPRRYSTAPARAFWSPTPRR